MLFVSVQQSFDIAFAKKSVVNARYFKPYPIETTFQMDIFKKTLAFISGRPTNPPKSTH